jgi:hypothetical protein
MHARPASIAFALLAFALLALTMRWHVPMMLWDHLDLVPIYAAWHDGTLAPSTLLAVHGGHLHALAYVVLLATTRISHGQTALDCVASWLLLVASAGVIVSFARETFGRDGRLLTILVVFLALYPGHLANLQWGWQVAVFLCIAGVVVAIRLLTLAALTPLRLAASIAAGGVALLSFATAGALVPTAIALIASRNDMPPRTRVVFALPWLVLGALFVLGIDAPAGGAHVADAPRYALNFIGAGIARFATPLAPWLALAGIATGTWAYAGVRNRRECLPWLGLCLFAGCAAALVAIGRAAPFGGAHAFVTRYVSFSSLFWIGWVGLMGMRLAKGRQRFVEIAIALVAAFAVANAFHMINKAREVGMHTAGLASAIRASYPDVDRAILGEIYFDQPDVALARLRALHDLGFAPFDARNADAPK